MRGVWKRSHGRTSEAPPDERGGNRYVRPTVTAPHPHSTPNGCHAAFGKPTVRTNGALPWIAQGRWPIDPAAFSWLRQQPFKCILQSSDGCWYSQEKEWIIKARP